MQSLGDLFKDLFKANSLSELEDSPNAIDLLKADHRKVQLLFSHIEEVEDSSKADVIQMLIKELHIHSKLEEELIYPLLDGIQHDETEEAREEHHHVKFTLGELARARGNTEKCKPKVSVLKELVEHHVKEEENSHFPALNKTDVDMIELAAKLKQRKKALSVQFDKSLQAGKLDSELALSESPSSETDSSKPKKPPAKRSEKESTQHKRHTTSKAKTASSAKSKSARGAHKAAASHAKKKAAKAPSAKRTATSVKKTPAERAGKTPAKKKASAKQTKSRAKTTRKGH